MLGFRAAVEAQDKVLALVVCGACFPRRFGEEEGAPVRDAANYAAGGEDLVASCSCDSVERSDGRRCRGGGHP